MDEVPDLPSDSKTPEIEKLASEAAGKPADSEPPERGGAFRSLRHLLFGKPRNPTDPHVFHSMSLIAFFAWVGLGADGLSSSAYGPDEAFRALAGHEYLALYLAAMMALTVAIISYAYSLMIEHFPTGGGGYVVASKLLGPKAGVVSGSALVVDYILTISISIASGADAIFSFLPIEWQHYKVLAAVVALAVLTVMNLRGVKESIKVLLPIFSLFVIMHVLLITYGVLAHFGQVPEILGEARARGASDVSIMGFLPLLFVFLRAYSLGGGTYTGIEAVSNGLQILREPRVKTGKRTMLYMSTSLAFTAGGILVCYLLWHAVPEAGKTMNAVLLENVFGDWSVGNLSIGPALVIITLLSEGALLFVAAQAGFIDGPRILSNMALDSWMPHGFASLSERLVTKNGIFVMGILSGALLIYTKGNVSFLVVLYSINVFLTFSLTNLAMAKFWVKDGRKTEKKWVRNLVVHLVGLALCLAILCVTTYEKFTEGGWLTIVVTSSLIGLCFLIQKHYSYVRAEIKKLDHVLDAMPKPSEELPAEPLDPAKPVAVLLVSGYGGLGVHSLLSIHRMYPGFYKDMMFVSVGSVDSGHFKGKEEIEALEIHTCDNLSRYEATARALGFRAASGHRLGTDVIDEAEALCREVAAKYPRATFYVGKLIFRKEKAFQKLLHNDTAYAIQRRLQFSGLATVILPIRMEIA